MKITHIEIYRKLEVIEQMLDEYLDANCIGIKDERFAFQVMLFTAIHHTILHLLNTLENNQKICLSCFYVKLKRVSQSASYYLKIHNPELLEDPGENFISDYEYLKNLVYKEIKYLVIEMGDIIGECKATKNTAYDKLKGKKTKREIRWGDDDDNDYDDDDDDCDWNGPSAPAPPLLGAVPSPY